MATQTNNIMLLELDAASPIRGQHRSIDALDDLVLSPTTIALSPSGAVSMNSTGSTIGIGNVSATGAISVGTAGNRAITLGNATNTGTFTINTGSGGFVLSTNATAGTIGIGTDNGTGAISIGTGTGSRAISIASGANDGAVNIATAATAGRATVVGNTTGSSSLRLFAGTGAATLSTGTTGGSINLTTTGFVGIADGAGTGAISIAGSLATGARTISIGTGGSGAKNITLGEATVAGSSTTINGGTAGGVNIAITAVAIPVNISTGSTAGTVAIGTGSAAHTLAFGTGLGNKTVQVGSTSGTSSLTLQTGTGAMTFGAGGAYDVNAAGLVTIDSSGNEIRIGADSVAQAIRIGTAGARSIVIGSTGASKITMSGGAGGIVIDNASANAQRGISQSCFNQGVATIAAGAIVALLNNPTVRGTITVTAASANAASSMERVPAGVNNFSVATGGFGDMTCVPGLLAMVLFDVAPANTDVGKPVYLSSTAGTASLTAPSASGQTIYRIGYLSHSTAFSGLYKIIWQPQFIADIP